MQSVSVRFDVAGERQLDRFFSDVIMLSRDFRPALVEMGDDWYETEREAFGAEGAFEGNPAWAQLSPAYAAWKAQHYPGRPILQRTGALMASLAEKGAEGSIYELTDDTLTLGSALRTKSGGWNLAMLHQTGTRKMPARKVGLLTQAQRIRWTRIVRENVEAIFSQAESPGLG